MTTFFPSGYSISPDDGAYRTREIFCYVAYGDSRDRQDEVYSLYLGTGTLIQISCIRVFHLWAYTICANIPRKYERAFILWRNKYQSPSLQILCRGRLSWYGRQYFVD